MRTLKPNLNRAADEEKFILKFALDFLPCFCFSLSLKSHPADEQFKTFNEASGCSSALANLNGNLDGQQSPPWEGQRIEIPLKTHSLLMLLLCSVLHLVQKSNYMNMDFY